MDRITSELKEHVETYAQLYEGSKMKVDRYCKALASMDDAKRSEFQKLANRARRIKSADDYRSFMEHVHEYAERIANGEAAKQVWMVWCDLREKEEAASIDALNNIYHESMKKALSRPIE